MDTGKQFEIEWTTYKKEMLERFNKRHSTKIGRWFFKPEHYNEKSIEYEYERSIAELFFVKGILFTQLIMDGKIKDNNNTVLEVVKNVNTKR